MTKYIVYEAVTRKNGTIYRHTKIRCASMPEAEREQRKYMERIGRFHEIRESKS